MTMNPDISYLFGAYFGDGHIFYKNGSYQLHIVSGDRELCEACQNVLLSNFDKTGTISHVKNSYYKLVCCSKEMCSFILGFFCSNPDYSKASAIEKKSILPRFSEIEEIKSFISGLLDSDGWIRRVGRDDRKYEIGFKNTSLLSKDIYDLMSTIVRCRKFVEHKNSQRYGNKCRDNFTWTIHPFDFFNSGLSFRIKRKQDMLMEYMNKRSLFRTKNKRVGKVAV